MFKSVLQEYPEFKRTAVRKQHERLYAQVLGAINVKEKRVMKSCLANSWFHSNWESQSSFVSVVV